MCGIVGYVGPKRAAPILLDGLRRLEYRGYDSAGVALVDGGTIRVHKEVGKVAMVQAEVPTDAPGHTGIAHTRWATHGSVTQANAHPHTDMQMGIAVVHNGIIDNDEALRVRLAAQGVEFCSETDTEVLPHLIRHHYKGDPTQAVIDALKEVRGTYGVVVAFAEHPGVMVAARLGSPLVIGLGEDENFIASDPHALVRYTRRVIYLEDHELATITADGVVSQHLDGSEALHTVEELEAAFGTGDKGSFEHYMLKEIHEQPESIGRCLRGRVQPEEGTARLGGFDLLPRDLTEIPSVTIMGCGTSFHAAMLGAMAIEQTARIPARAVIASEFRWSNPQIDPKGLYLAVSQSGETADTLGAIKEVRTKGGKVLGVVNVVGSSIARLCGGGVYIHSGPEVAVASTKAFTSQISAMYLFTLMLGRTLTLAPNEAQHLARSLADLPEMVRAYLGDPGPIQEAVRHLVNASYVLFMGRGLSWPVALEGALKLKELAYIPCEAYAAGEMKHGPIAMMEQGTPVIVIVPSDANRERTLSNMREVQARGACLIVIHSRGDHQAASLAAVSIPVPRVHPLLTPMVTVLPLQLLSYQAALAMGRDIDMPRNLAKSVTVE